MRSRLFVQWLPVAAMTLVLAPAASAHHSFGSEFDDSSAITLQGVVASVELVNPHSFIYLDVKTGHGTVERWALEGPGVFQLRRMGVDQAAVRPGDEIGVCGYPARREVVGTRPEPATGKGARKLQAAVLTLKGSPPRPWNNYGRGKCILDTNTWAPTTWAPAR